MATMRKVVSMVIDSGKAASADMKRSGVEGKMHERFEAFPRRPQCIRIVVISTLQRMLVNAAISEASTKGAAAYSLCQLAC